MILLGTASLKNPDLGEGVVVGLAHCLVALTVLIIYGVQAYKATARVILPNLVLFVYISVGLEIYKVLRYSPTQNGEYLEIVLQILIWGGRFVSISLISSLIAMIYTKLQAKSSKLSQEENTSNS
jgi:hypothetical protein